SKDALQLLGATIQTLCGIPLLEADLPKRKSVKKKVSEPVSGTTRPSVRPVCDPHKALDQLIGLSNVKAKIRELASFAKVNAARVQAGLPGQPLALHAQFIGNPGTGKTTVARLLGDIYADIGVLGKGHLIGVGRSGLVPNYVGQTATKTGEVIES